MSKESDSKNSTETFGKRIRKKVIRKGTPLVVAFSVGAVATHWYENLPPAPIGRPLVVAEEKDGGKNYGVLDQGIPVEISFRPTESVIYPIGVSVERDEWQEAFNSKENKGKVPVFEYPDVPTSPDDIQFISIDKLDKVHEGILVAGAPYVENTLKSGTVSLNPTSFTGRRGEARVNYLGTYISYKINEGGKDTMFYVPTSNVIFKKK